MAKIVIFKNVDFEGEAKTLTDDTRYLGDFNNEVSSFIILDGTWRFHGGANFGGYHSEAYGPTERGWIENIGITNDTISSIELV